MRYKDNVLEKLGQIDNIANRLNIQVNRGGTQDQVLESIEMLKEAIERTREIISVEADEFEQQFRPQ
jgi:hypothetical protein